MNTKNILLPLVFLIVGVVATSFFFMYLKPKMDELAMMSSKKDENRYVNEEYGFSFKLDSQEEAILCENKNENTDAASVYVIIKGESSGISCDSGGSLEEINVIKKNYDNSQLKTPTEIVNSLVRDYYNYTTEEYTISDVKGLRVKGTIKEGKTAPLPDNIDEVIINKDGVLYIITSDFYSKNVEIF